MAGLDFDEWLRRRADRLRQAEERAHKHALKHPARAHPLRHPHGGRHEGWAHKRFIGDQLLAQLYLPEARKVLGFVLDEAGRNGLMTYSHTHKLKDGTVITGEVIGNQPRVTIDVTRTQPGREVILEFDNFVCYPRDTGHPNGIDPEHPQLVLKPVKPGSVDGDPTWKTLFYSSSVPGFDGFPGPKGTYRFVRGVDAFPKGLQHAGNVDWIGKQKQRVSWYGPSARYFPDPYVQPRSQYGKFVFHLGQVLLDVDQYCIDSEQDFADRYVLGAAMVGSRLLVVMAALEHKDTSTADVPAHTTDFDAPWPINSVTVSFVRFSLGSKDIPDAMRLSVVKKSRKVLWTDTLPGAVCPAIFSPDGRTAIMLSMPQLTLYFVDYSSPDLGDPKPSTSNPQHTFTFTAGSTPAADSVVHNAIDTTMHPLGTGTIAYDWEEDVQHVLQVTRTDTPLIKSMFSLRLDDGDPLPLYSETSIGDPLPDLNRHIEVRYLLFADLRRSVLVLLHIAFDLAALTQDVTSLSCTLEVYREGAVAGTITLDPDDVQAIGLPRFFGYFDRVRNRIKDVDLAPLFALYAVSASTDAFGNVSFSYDGGCAGWACLPYPESQMFGNATANNTGAPHPPTAIAPLTDAGFDSNKADTHGYYSVLGCASSKDTTLLCCYGLTHGGGNAKFGIYGKNDGSTFETLTNVTGGNRRYHPLWLVGALPKQPTEVPV